MPANVTRSTKLRVRQPQNQSHLQCLRLLARQQGHQTGIGIADRSRRKPRAAVAGNKAHLAKLSANMALVLAMRMSHMVASHPALPLVHLPRQ